MIGSMSCHTATVLPTLLQPIKLYLYKDNLSRYQLSLTPSLIFEEAESSMQLNFEHKVHSYNVHNKTNSNRTFCV